MREVVGQTADRRARWPKAAARSRPTRRSCCRSILDTTAPASRSPRCSCRRSIRRRRSSTRSATCSARKLDQRALRNEAEAYRNDILPRARGDAVAHRPGGARPTRQQVVAAGAGRRRALPLGLSILQGVAGRDPAPALHRDDGEILKNTNKVIIDKSPQRARACCPICRCPRYRRAAVPCQPRRHRSRPARRRPVAAVAPTAGRRAMNRDSRFPRRRCRRHPASCATRCFSSSSRPSRRSSCNSASRVRVIVDPGLQFKLPLFRTSSIYDRRVLDFEPPPEEVIASDQKRLVVDTYARFRIVNPLQFYQTVGTEARGRQRLDSHHQRSPAPRARQCRRCRP